MTVEIETKDTTSEKNDKRSSLLDKLKKASVIKETDVMSESKFFDDVEDIVTNVPAMNVALSGDLKKGFTTGLTVWAGPSKHFKTSFTLLMVKAYLDKYKNSICIFYDSEFGSPQSYFQSFGIDTSRVLHVPIANIEELKQDIAAQLVAISKGDKVIIAVDSVGNLASKKEVDDAIDQKTVADMTRAKQLKSLFRIVTPQLTIKKIPMIVVNHTYMEQGMYPKAIVSGGTGIYYSASAIFILGRQQEKEGTEIVGYNFVINVEKSRYVKEKSKIPIGVSYDNGIDRFSGLMDMALEGKFVVKPSNGWYSVVNQETGEVNSKKYRFDETNTDKFWKPILNSKKFQEWVNDRYMIAKGSIMSEEELEQEALIAIDDSGNDVMNLVSD